jgi:hypothetical protein
MNLALEHVDMSPSLIYECLSHAWESDDHDPRITINNSASLFSSTLHVALENFCYTSQERNFWILDSTGDMMCFRRSAPMRPYDNRMEDV